MFNLFLITSVIKVLENHSEKSFCDHPRRQHETLKTINSIREKIPDVKIFLLECSDMSNEQEHFLKGKVDIFLNLSSESNISETVSKSKSQGEKMMIIRSLEYLEKEKIEYESLFKISGRYWLNNNFNIDNFINDSYTVKFVENNNLLSNFFKLPNRLVLNFKEYLNTTDIIDYEFKNYFTRFIKSLNDEENKKEIRDKIGVSGFKSMNGKFIDI